MTSGPTYCRAFPLRDLMMFSAWDEVSRGAARDLSEEAVVYIWEDHSVALDPIAPGRGLLVDPPTPA